MDANVMTFVKGIDFSKLAKTRATNLWGGHGITSSYEEPEVLKHILKSTQEYVHEINLTDKADASVKKAWTDKSSSSHCSSKEHSPHYLAQKSLEFQSGLIVYRKAGKLF